jgi:hypothetical protein
MALALLVRAARLCASFFFFLLYAGRRLRCLSRHAGALHALFFSITI